MKPCGKCGGNDRNASGGCRPCQARRTAAWGAANSGKEKLRKATYYAANREQVKARSRQWDADNPEKRAANRRAWQKANPDKVNASSAAWRSANPEKRKRVVAAWDAANPEKKKKAEQAWRAKNADVVRLYDHNRRARKRANGGTLSEGLRERLFKLQRGKCACCRKPLGEKYELDHRMPLELGGANEDWNMQLLRQRCNRQKHTKHPVDFMQSRGFLL
jgi:5-methylcytosine-specific restriction endonuclease McrA